MIKLLAFLWCGCWHRWKTISFGNLVEKRGDLAIGMWFHERCTKCGRNRYRG